ncbi:hypothetical protein BKA62DRAFT_118007 [Auriculariales sp. MPI-PUGE-AT-0066]|nr:hypothetical protein BKA62DRAFT_118007 [Auriculariales sp. MPI-PUGE-AT-0066]
MSVRLTIVLQELDVKIDRITLEISRQDLAHFSRRPLLWFATVAHGAVYSNLGTMYSVTNGHIHKITDWDIMNDSLAHSYEYHLQPASTADIINLAVVKTTRGSTSETSCVVARDSPSSDIRKRDGAACVFTGDMLNQESHIISHRNKYKGRWGPLIKSLCINEDIRIDGPRNILTLSHDLRHLIDEHKYAILPVGFATQFSLLEIENLDTPQQCPSILQAGRLPWFSEPPNQRRAFQGTFVLQAIPPKPAPPPQSQEEEQAQREEQKFKAFSSMQIQARFPHNTIAHFPVTGDDIALPHELLLLHAYSGTILKRYCDQATRDALFDDTAVTMQPSALGWDNSNDGEDNHDRPSGCRTGNARCAARGGGDAEADIAAAVFDNFYEPLLKRAKELAKVQKRAEIAEWRLQMENT